MSGAAPTVLGVDGGNSKTDVALVDTAGRLFAAVRGPTVSHQQVPAEVGIARLSELAAELDGRRQAAPVIGVFCLAGADFPRDARRLAADIGVLGLAAQSVVLNDAFAPLRAGTDQRWGVAVVCGAGVNAAGIGPDGRTARLAALGDVSGDWGGGMSLGMAGLGAAVRARDGRGPRTTLERLVPAHFGLHRPAAVTEAVYDGRIAEKRLRELSPVVFRAAGGGDRVARDIVDRLAEEIGVMAIAIARRLHMVRRSFDVVLAGGVFRTTDATFYAAVERRIADAAPQARTVRLAAPPVAGAALLALDRLGLSPDARTAARLRRALVRWEGRL